MLQNIRVDGLIMTPPISDCGIAMDALEKRRIPYVRLAPESFPGRGPAVAIDDEKAAWLVGEHLVAHGHSKFGIVNGPANHGAANARRKGFLEALAAHGLNPPNEAYGGFQFDVSISAGKELMAGPDRPTAIFAANDDSAAGVMAALAEIGLKVPGDVSVVGFDDSWIARSVWPHLTTVYQPIAEMAHRAVEILLDRKNALQRNETHWLDFHLVERSSVMRASKP